MGIKVAWLGVAVMSVGLVINDANYREAISIAGCIILVCGVIALIMDK